MNEIQVGDRRFEVIGYDGVGKHNLTHALLCESTLVDAKYVLDDYYDHEDQDWVELTMPNGYNDSLFLRNLKYYDIILLREIVSKPFEIVSEPIEFLGEVVRIGDGRYYGNAINVPVHVKPGMRFKCVEVKD